MISKLLRALRHALKPETTLPNLDSTALNEAIATLLIEAARVDDNTTEADIAEAKKSLKLLANINSEQADVLLGKVSLPKNRPTSYLPLTRTINQNLDYDQKCVLIGAMWAIAHSDSHIDPHEDHIIRKISDLIYVSHRDFINQKIKSQG
jgi:uncharacterized tellurite resistance protein B-like protein